ncbi:DUF2065 domain-containing protein [Methylophilaceae bacterium]|nr:DUF2065 domain-containing protein [Methylophilaceae bacterium]
MQDTIYMALGLVFIFEGIFPLALPEAWRDAFSKMVKFKTGQIRFYGLLSILIGIIIIFIGK